MAHWGGHRNVPDAAYATNAKWPEPWQPWQRVATEKRRHGPTTQRRLEGIVKDTEHEVEEAEMIARRKTALFHAILQGDKDEFEEALKACKHLDMRAHGTGCTPLMVAAASGEIQMCKALLDAGANLHARDNSSGASAFHMAANKGRQEVVTLFLKHADEVVGGTYKLLQGTTKKGETPLMGAAKAGHADVVKMARMAFRMAALGAFHRHAEAAAVVQDLLDAGASHDARAPKESHKTALHIACAKGHTQVAKLLLDRGAAIDDCDDQGIRPLMYAAAGGSAECVSALLGTEPPPDLEAYDERGRTALLHAASSGRVEVLQVLEAKGADLRARTLAGSTGLLLACRHGHEAVLGWWLSKEERAGDLHEERGASGETPLHMAVRSGELQVVARLIDRGAMLEQKDAKGWTALSWAAANGDMAMIRVLLDRGSNLLASDYKGRVPRKLADQKGHTAAAELLRKRAQLGLVRTDLANEEEYDELVGTQGADPKEHYLKTWRRLQGYT